jgi:membrane protein YdbS with pleckstrin-like domain
MSLERFKQKAEHLRVKARWMAIASDVTYLAAHAFLGIQYTRVPNLISRAGLAILAAGSLYVAWRAHKQLWPLSPVPNLSATTGLEAYRSELQRSRDHSRKVWRMVAPLIPGAVVFALPGIGPFLRKALEDPKVVLTNAVPICVLLAIWLVFLLPVRRRKLRKIQGEIDTLDQLAHSGLDSPGQRGN